MKVNSNFRLTLNGDVFIEIRTGNRMMTMIWCILFFLANGAYPVSLYLPLYLEGYVNPSRLINVSNNVQVFGNPL